MGIISNIKENVRDIGQGIRDVVTGKKSSPYSRKQKRIASDYESSRDIKPTDTGFTPEKDSSGRIVYNSPRGGGGSGGGSSSNNTPTPTQTPTPTNLRDTTTNTPTTTNPTSQDLRNKTLLDNMRSKGTSRLNKLEAQKQQAIKEQTRIETERIKILSQGGKEKTKTYRDVKTGDVQEVTTIKGRGSEKIVEVKNLNTGVTTISTYGTGKGGGGVRATGGIKVKEEVQDFKGNNIYFSNIKNIEQAAEPDRTGQIYSSQSNMFLASAYGIGAGGTAIMTPPTIKEQKQIDLASVPVSERIDKFETKIFGEKTYGGKTKLDKYLESKRILESEQPFFSPSNVKKGFDYAAEQTLRGGEFLASQAEKRGIVKDKLLLSPTPISREGAKEFLSEVYMFSAFSPLISTGNVALEEAQSRNLAGYEKYIRQPVKRVVTLEPELKQVSKNVNVRATEGRYLNLDGSRNVKFKTRGKGSVAVDNEVPTGRWYGSVEETQSRWLRKPKILKGEVKIVDGKYTETINYPRNIKKVVEVEGKVETTSIFKKGKLIKKIEQPSQSIPDIKLKSFEAETKSQVSLGTEGETASASGDMLGFKLKTPKVKDLRTGLETKETKGFIEFGKDTRSGVSVRVDRGTSVYDITRANPKSIVRSVSEEGKTLTSKKLISQKVVYAEGKVSTPKDYTGFTKFGGDEKLIKIQQGDIDRLISQKQNIKVTTIFETPKGNIKVIDEIKPIEPEVIKLKPVRKKLEYDEKTFLNIEGGKIAERTEVTGVVTKGDKILQYKKLPTQQSNILEIPKPQEYLSPTPNIKLPKIPKLSEIKQQATTPKPTAIIELTKINPSKQVSAKNISIQPQVIEFKSKQASKTKQVSILKPAEDQISKSKSIQEQAQAQSQAQQQKQQQITKQLLKQQTQQKISDLLKNKNIETPKPKTPKQVIIKVPMPKNEPARDKLKQIASTIKGEYEVFTKTKGKDISIGKEVTLKKAAKKLSKGLKGGLEASGFITEKKTGRKLSFAEVSKLISSDFAASKVDPFRVVQKKSKRLGTKSETIKIKKARKITKKRKPTKWLI